MKYIDGRPRPATEGPTAGTSKYGPPLKGCEGRTLRITFLNGHALVVDNGTVRRLSREQAEQLVKLVDSMGWTG